MKIVIWKKKLITLVLILVSGLIILVSGDKQILIHVACLGALSLGACFIVNFDVFHPYFWYSIFFWLYSSAYPILYYIGYNTSYGYDKESIILEWLFLSVILLVLPAEKVVDKYNIYDNSEKTNAIACFTWIFSFYLCITMILIYFGGFSNKTDIYNNANAFIKTGFIIGYILILFYEYILYGSLYKNKKIGPINIIPLIIVTSFSFLTGERDYMFTTLLSTILLLFLFNKLKKKAIFIIVPIGIILLPLSSSLKYYLLSGKKGAAFSMSNLLPEFLDGEFISAGRNFQILLNGHYSGYFGGKTILYDLGRIFTKNIFSVQTWFNNTFFSYSQSTKYGFSLVGEGYINFGVIGVVLLAFIVGIIIRVLYLQSNKNQYNMLIYLYMLPLFIYSIRADLANIFSPLLKYALLGTMIIYILQHVQIVIGRNK